MATSRQTPRITRFANSFGIKTGNSALTEAMQSECGNVNAAQSRQCVTDYLQRPAIIAQACVEAPAVEEAIFRFIPSALVDELELPGVPENTIAGISRRSLFIGGFSTVLFGYAHNFGLKNGRYSFDSKAVPVSQIMGGAILWAIQRTMGFPAAVLTHATHNAASIYRFPSAK